MTELDDFPLVQNVDLMLAILRKGIDAGATIEARVDRVIANLEQVRVRAAPPRVQLVERRTRTFVWLETAGCVERVSGAGYRTTSRGSSLLESYPRGVDNSVLMQCPEFQRYIELQGEKPVEAEIGAFDKGHQAFLDGRPATANPYGVESAGHQLWENGWSQVADQYGPAVPDTPPDNPAA